MKTSYRGLDYESGRAIQTLRSKIGLTQAGLAEYLGVSGRTVREWEAGGNHPKAEHLKALMALAVQSQAFPKESEAQEIRTLWKTIRQKERIDEDWLSALLSELPPPQGQSHEWQPSHVVPPHAVAPVPENRSQGVELSPPDLEVDAAVSAPSPVTSQQGRISAGHSQNRARMLRRLGHSYRELMSQSLQGTVWLELGLTHKPDAVQNAANLLLRVKHGAEQLLPAGTSIAAAYDQAEHELLILGAPGSGKSTLLLDLAQKLILRAEQDETHPLPVILPLSTWAVRRGSLEDWMAEQVSEIYDVPQKLSAQWVREGTLLPLLDGLDEMEEALRPACIEWINAYRHARFRPLVVCSRSAEYAAAAEQKLLTLQSAVVVQPLTHVQVESYLVQAGKQLSTLHTTLKEHPALQELVTTPLMLNLFILTYRETGPDHLPDTQAPLQVQIWTDYVARMVERKGNAKRYPHARTVSSLRWLAQHMQTRNQTVFYLEHLQLDWLSASQQRSYSWWAVRLPGILVGILVSLIITKSLVGTLNTLALWFQLGVLGGLLGGLCAGDGLGETVRTEEARGKRTVGAVGVGKGLAPFPCACSASAVQNQKERRLMWRKRVVLSLFIGLLLVCSFGLNRIDQGSLPHDWLHSGSIVFVVFVCSSVAIQFFVVRIFYAYTPAASNRPIGRWKRLVHVFQTVHVKLALIIMGVIGLSYGLSAGLSVGLNHGLSVGLISGLDYGLSEGLIFGLSSVLMSLILRGQAGSIQLTERLRWTWRSFSKSLFLFDHLRVLWPLTSGITLFIGLSEGLHWGLERGPAIGLGFGPSSGLSIGLGSGLIYWLLSGLIQGIAQERIQDQDRRVPNEGIQRSLRNGAIISIISGGIIGLISMLMMVWVNVLSNGLLYMLSNKLGNALRFGLSYGLSSGLSYGLQIGLLGGLLVFMSMGGIAAFRHYVIRFLLWRSHTFPARAPQFLDDARARFLLRRVGGGYSFIHRLLLDYFAACANSGDEPRPHPQENERTEP